jgi:segregation and condensation protein B
MDMPKKQKPTKQGLLEAALFSAGRPVSLEDLSAATHLSLRELPRLLTDLMETYQKRIQDNETALEVGIAGDKYVMQVRYSYAHVGQKLAPMEIPTRLLGTLALIAYHQPIRQSQLRDMIGQKVYDHVGELIDRGLLVAKKESRTKLLSTSPSFPEYFGLSTTDKEQIRNFLLKKIKPKKETLEK